MVLDQRPHDDHNASGNTPMNRKSNANGSSRKFMLILTSNGVSQLLTCLLDAVVEMSLED